LWHQGLYLRHRSLDLRSSIWHGARLTRWSLLATSIIGRLNSYHWRVDSGRQRQVALADRSHPTPKTRKVIRDVCSLNGISKCAYIVPETDSRSLNATTAV
jgi:hypothetical protein